jgi:hypothetical protein
VPVKLLAYLQNRPDQYGYISAIENLFEYVFYIFPTKYDLRFDKRLTEIVFDGFGDLHHSNYWGAVAVIRCVGLEHLAG